jgi:hypothetical protein
MSARLVARLSMRAALLLVLASPACGTAPPPAGRSGGAGASGWDAFVGEFLEAYFGAHPDAAVQAGRHEFDGRLPDWSAAGLRREAERLREWRGRALDFDPAGVDPERGLERRYLLARIDHDLFWLEEARWPQRNPYFYADALDPNVYVTREYAPPEARLRAYTAYAREVPRALDQIRANLDDALPRTYIDIGRTTFGGLASYYEKDVPGAFAAVRDEGLLAEFRATNEGAVRAAREIDRWLESRRADATDGFALGTERFSRMLLQTERVGLTLDHLEEAGRQDMERNLAALREACAALDPALTVPRCIARVQARKPAEGPVAGAQRQLTVLRRFIEEKGIVSIPGPEEARVAEAPPYKRWNFAYIDIPGPYETALPSTYYIAPPDPSWTPREREAYVAGEAPLLFVSVHEVWPGHFLQFLHANRARSKFGQVFVGYAFAEGWAHYAEEMMWEAGLGDGDPATRVGMLLNALLRDARYLSAIGLHARGMTVAESEALFRDRAHQDAGTARQQAARGTFDPAYLNYTLGKLMIRRLREEWTEPRGGRQAWREFHDRFLSYGGPPIPLVREAMLGPGAGAPL